MMERGAKTGDTCCLTKSIICVRINYKLNYDSDI